MEWADGTSQKSAHSLEERVMSALLSGRCRSDRLGAGNRPALGAARSDDTDDEFADVGSHGQPRRLTHAAHRINCGIFDQSTHHG